jgi:hypothetical protein
MQLYLRHLHGWVRHSKELESFLAFKLEIEICMNGKDGAKKELARK